MSVQMMTLTVRRHGHVHTFAEELTLVRYCQSPRSRYVHSFT